MKMFAQSRCICQHQQQRTSLLSTMLILKIFIFITICANLPQNVSSQIAYKGRLSELRIKELRNIAYNMDQSINSDVYACESFYDYVCSHNKPLYSVLGSLPNFNELIQLLTEIENDPEQFDAKEKLVNFVISCNGVKSIEQCYYETFVYFKPLFGYIINKNHIDGSSHEFHTFHEVLDNFLRKAEETENFLHNHIRLKIATLREHFRRPQKYFHAGDLNKEYEALRIYRESYKHNVRNLEQHRKRNSTFEVGMQKTMLDWSLYVYQSSNKPMSYYFSTLNVHLWMTLYNSTERLHEPKRFLEIADCLKLPQYVHVLHEARVLAVVYLKSFRNAWQEYSEWIVSPSTNQEIYDQENEVLREFHLNNKRIFFTLYAQNFCELGKELAEHIFYLGLKQNQDFFSVYSCGYQTERLSDCV